MLVLLSGLNFNHSVGLDLRKSSNECITNLLELVVALAQVAILDYQQLFGSETNRHVLVFAFSNSKSSLALSGKLVLLYGSALDFDLHEAQYDFFVFVTASNNELL